MPGPPVRLDSFFEAAACMGLSEQDPKDQFVIPSFGPLLRACCNWFSYKLMHSAAVTAQYAITQPVGCCQVYLCPRYIA
jgi:hypothetical protein